MKWEVALVDEEKSRTVVATDVETDELWSYVATALESEPLAEGRRTPAVLVTRMDRLPQTWQQRVADLIDVQEGEDKNGKPLKKRKFRYGKVTMKVWDRMVMLNKWRPKGPSKEEQLADSRRVVTCRNGAPLCACLVLAKRCRVEEEIGVPSPRKG